MVRLGVSKAAEDGKGSSHGGLEMSGSRVEWMEILRQRQTIGTRIKTTPAGRQTCSQVEFIFTEVTEDGRLLKNHHYKLPVSIHIVKISLNCKQLL